MNIRFEYFYRDAGNYKEWGSVVFSNHQDLAPEVLTRQIREMLIEQTYFIANEAGVADLHFAQFDPTQDHGWHEFESLEYTADPPTDPRHRDFHQFIADLEIAGVQLTN